MKDPNTHIIDEITRDKGNGMTVPEGYFNDFAVKMAGKLPFREELDVPAAKQSKPRNSRWLQVRPYVYMAAMFAGAWCLIKMFTLMSPAASDVNINNYPALSLALEDEQFVDEYIIDGISSYDVYEDSYNDGIESLDSLNFENAGYILPTDGDYSTPPYETETNEEQ